VSVAAPGQIAVLPAGVAGRADIVWQADVGAPGTLGALLAAMPTFTPTEPHSEKLVADGPRLSGRMIALANTGGRWTQLQLEEPRRG